MNQLAIPQFGGELGVRQTLNHMRVLANQAFTDPVIRDQAALAVTGCARGARDCQCYALMSFVAHAVHYVADPQGVELLHHPRLVAHAVRAGKVVYGDCDDMSMYLAALLKSVGLAPTFRAVGYNGRPYQHVYVMCEGHKLDATRSPWLPVNLYPVQETLVMEGRI